MRAQLCLGLLRSHNSKSSPSRKRDTLVLRAAMVMLRAARRVLPRGVRSVGNYHRGADNTDLKAALDHSKDLVLKQKLSYGEFKHQCEAIRLFVFWGLIGALSIDLLMNPLKSSYFWNTWHPMSMPGNIKKALWGPSGGVFLEEPLEREADAATLAAKLVQRRRLD